mgnify:CR=1 FL=1
MSRSFLITFAPSAIDILPANQQMTVEAVFEPAENAIAGDYIGTDVTGARALGNGLNPGTSGVGSGVHVTNGAQSNRIGTDGNGVSGLLTPGQLVGVIATIPQDNSDVSGTFSKSTIEGLRVLYIDPRFAASLAQASTEPTGTPRVPPYEPPYLAAETTSTVDVAVVWRADGAFPEWPVANVFRLALEDGLWVVVDAIEADPAPEPLDTP